MRNYLEREIRQWLHSPGRAAQIAAARYLEGKHDILARERRVIGRGGQLEAARNLPNNRLVDNQYAKLARQKVNYLVGTPFEIVSAGDSLADIHAFLNRRRRKTLYSACLDAVGAGIGWVLTHFDAEGRLCLKRIPPYELLPFWADSDHTVLDCAARVFEQDVMDYELNNRRVRHVELYRREGMERYTLEDGKLTPDGRGAWLSAGGRPWGWGQVPLTAFKAPGEQPLLGRVKSLQDALNALLSDFQNSLQEDARNTILVLKNYDGADLAEFRHNLAAYGAVRVKTVDGTQGGVETLRVHVDHTSYETLASMLKRAIMENGMGFDIGDGILRGTPNRMTLTAMYADIELDADGYETEWKASFEELFGFLGAEGATVVFKRYAMDVDL
ncbi:MAG: phage portal protein [Oscillospiraceae bacterium]|nr:phage portal protein [Oscillospiraceae bacterium]